MELNSITLLGNSSIGIFSLASSSYAVIPYNTDEETRKTISDTLRVPIIQTSINNSSLNGLFAVGNSHQLLVSHLVSETEYENILAQLPSDVELSLMDSTLTALGNVILTTDKLALVSPEFNQSEREFIGDVLDVEIVTRQILDTTIVGSMLYSNGRGILAHPLTSDEDLDWLEDTFSIAVDVVTVNRGTPYPRPGLTGNERGILVGSDTTGPELMRIFDVLSR